MTFMEKLKAEEYDTDALMEDVLDSGDHDQCDSNIANMGLDADTMKILLQCAYYHQCMLIYHI